MGIYLVGQPFGHERQRRDCSQHNPFLGATLFVFHSSMTMRRPKSPVRNLGLSEFIHALRQPLAPL